MLDWFHENWQFILIGVSTASVIFNIILLLVHKVPLKKIMNIIRLIPSIINQAETMFPVSGYGTTKREIVKSLFNDLLVLNNCQKYSKYFDIDSLIEDYLETPQKKKDEMV